ncbi:MAG: CHAT domain-containing protein [bacterium]|nr:CHAT domain-containing protein [bacterium]
MTLLEEARAVLATAREDPQSALQRAGALLQHEAPDTVGATLHFAIGMAHRSLASGAKSTSHLEAATELAADDDELLGQILRSLAFNYAQAGDHRRGDRTILKSIKLLTGQERDLSRLQQAFMLLMRGEHRKALPVLSAAVDGFSTSGDDDYLELTLYNRALVHMEFGDYDASVADLDRSYTIATRLGHQVSAADAALHLSQVLGWKDDVPAAMQWHKRSADLRDAAEASNPLADTEHAFVLIQARLLREAEETLRSALPRLVEAGGNHAIAAAGRLALAEVLLEAGNHAEALVQIEQAEAESPRDGRWRFDIAAAHHRVRAAGGETSSKLVRSMVATAEDMEKNGERNAAAVERCRAIEVALRTADMTAARALADDVRRSAVSGPLWLQLQSWTALAELRMADGNQRGAAAAVQAGMRRLDEYRSGIGATDLRLHAAELGITLGRVGMRLALDSESPSRVFALSERLRSAAATRTAATPEIDAALANLRREVTRLRTAEPAQIAQSRRRVRAAERAISALARQARRDTDASARIGIAGIQASLNGRTLVEFVHSGTEIHAVVVRPDETRLVTLGSATPVDELVDHLLLAAERIARPSTSAASRQAAITSAHETCQAINATLVEPCSGDDRPLVIVPSGRLHSIPWGLVCDVPVETAPSATEWLAAAKRTPRQGPAQVIHGPDLAHAAAEVTMIASGTDATVTRGVGETVDHLSKAASAHFACHARPRVDSPMFSSLVLDDGELTLHDIERLDDVPSTIVLAACAGGSTVLASGEEVVSLAGSFLSMGARTVVAPLFTVSDETTYRVMGMLQSALATGGDAAAALFDIRHSEDPAVAFTAGSFSCFGTG